jgi:single-strand DNA-binding protein
MISATVTGNLGKECRIGDAGGTPVVNFTMASRRWDHKEKKDGADWVDVAFFGSRAEKISEYLTKGARVAVRGSLYQREYTHNNEKRYALTLRADDVELLSSKEDREQPPKSRDEFGSKPQDDDEIPF